ncbi:MAG: hypothetical protein IT437_09815 [Phycisphaerales bacterium]|nr:hypothetical protein [Phycisphaerales bacterium]
MMRRCPSTPRCRGGIYIAVLGAAMLVTILGMAAMAAVAVERITVEVTADVASARCAAESGVDLAMLTIKNQSTWRTARANGTWFSDVAIGGAKVSVEVTDPLDADLSNRDTDTILVKATAVRGQARHITQVSLQIQGDPADALKMAMHTPGNFHVDGAAVLAVSGAPVSTNGTFANDGTVKGSLECAALLPLGTVSGTVTLLAPAKAVPNGIVVLYASLASPFSASGIFEDQLLTPVACTAPGGAVNSAGVYLLSATGDVTIRNIRLWGTLVIRSNGNRVRIENSELLQRYRPDYPVLVIDGDAEIALDSAVLTEGARNMNPPGSPYQSITDIDTSDTYPSQIDGLVYATGKLTIVGPTKITGAVMAGSTALSNAILIQGSPEVAWDPGLLAAPPLGFMQNARMTIIPGSWAQATAP